MLSPAGPVYAAMDAVTELGTVLPLILDLNLPRGHFQCSDSFVLIKQRYCKRTDDGTQNKVVLALDLFTL